MTIVINGETYYTLNEAASYLGVSRETFYQRYKPHLQAYKQGPLKRQYYRETDLKEINQIRPVTDDEE